MNEEEARAWIRNRFGETRAEDVGRFLQLVVEENGRQNLIAPSTVATIYSRHAVDSLQLLDHVTGKRGERWIDIGTGGGFPGLVVALVSDFPMLLVEPRRKRAAFLAECIDRFGIGNRVEVACRKVEHITHQAGILSARAVSSIENLLQQAQHCSTVTTRWLLPRGRLNDGELVALAERWQMMFHVEHSITDPQSSIVILDGVQSR